jgi:hypothetical protein
MRVGGESLLLFVATWLIRRDPTKSDESCKNLCDDEVDPNSCEGIERCFFWKVCFCVALSVKYVSLFPKVDT